jgi:hypothetical protein
LEVLEENGEIILGNGKSVHVLNSSISVGGQAESYFLTVTSLDFSININYFFT